MIGSNWTKFGWPVAILTIGCLGLLLGNRFAPELHAAPEAADSESKQLPPAVVATIDIAKIFKQYEKFNKMMMEVKSDIEVFDEFVKTNSAELKELGEKHKLLPAGSDEAAQAELHIKQATLTLQTKVEQKKASLLKQEGEIYFDCYAEIEKAVKLQSRKRGITLVLRSTNDAMNRNDRNSVLQGVNRVIVHTQESYDLTDAVLKTLNGG